MSPSEAQNAACCVLEKVGYKINKTAGEALVKSLSTSPIYVFEQWLENYNFRRVIVGPTWITVTMRRGCEKAHYLSYRTAEYAKLKKYATAGEPQTK